LRKHQARIEGASKGKAQYKVFNGELWHNNLGNMPERYNDSVFLIRKHVVEMVCEEKVAEFFLVEGVWDFLKVMQVEPMLLVLHECPEDYPHHEVSDAVGQIGHLGLLAPLVLDLERVGKKHEAKRDNNHLVEADI
jgi:hypothetical protein